MAEAQPYYGQSMDSSLGRAFLPLPRWFSLANPPFQEVIKSKHGDILLLPESSTNDDSCWNAGKMVNQTESHPLFNNAISLCSQFFGAYLLRQRSRGWERVESSGENHLQIHSTEALNHCFHIIVWMHPSLEPSCLCATCQPAFLEVMKSKHGGILVLPESSTNVDGCWNAEKMVNYTESHRLFNYATSLCSLSTILWGMLVKKLIPWLGTG